MAFRSAHGFTHQYGGSDEVGTATPGANAIPKASSGGKLDSWISTSSESDSGIAEIATQTETNTGTDDSRIITPLKLATYVASALSGYATTSYVSTAINNMLAARVKTVQFTGVTLQLTYTVTHNLNTERLLIAVRDTTTDSFISFTADTANDANSVQITLVSITNGRVYDVMFVNAS